MTHPSTTWNFYVRRLQSEKEDSTVKIVQKSAVNEGDYTVLTFKTSLFTHQCQAFHLVKSHMGKAQGGQI